MSASPKLDEDKIAEVALALLSLTENRDGRVWKSFDWSLMDQLHTAGWISDPTTKAKSVYLTEKGHHLAKRLLVRLFATEPGRDDSKRRGGRVNALPAGLDEVLAIRCTAKLLKELGVKPVEVVPEELPLERDWHATITRIDRRKCLLFTHTSTLYSIPLLGVRKADFDSLAGRLSTRLKTVLSADGIEEHERILPSSPSLVFAKTNNRSVVGSMVDLCYQLEGVVLRGPSPADEISAAQRINRTPMIAGLNGQYPVEAMVRLVHTLS